MSISRRSFIASTAIVGSAMFTGQTSVSASEQEQKQGVLKLSIQEGIVPGKSLKEKIEKMSQWGFVGIEPGGGGLAKRVSEFQEALQGTDIKVSAICAGFQGVPISEDPAVREKCKNSCAEILQAAGELGSTGLIIVPAFNGQTKLDFVEGRKVLIDFLRELGPVAESAKTRILLEPLNRGEAWFLRQLADAAAICRDVNHPAICMMGDFYHMGKEETNEYAAFLTAAPWLHHVHLASRPNREEPGFNPKDSFKEGMRALKEIGYQDYCSYECGMSGKPEETIPKTVAYIRQQWEEA